MLHRFAGLNAILFVLGTCLLPKSGTSQTLSLPLVDCQIDHAIELLTRDQPTNESLETMSSIGFVMDFATGALRWRAKDGVLQRPVMWTVAPTDYSVNDLFAYRRHQIASGSDTIEVMRVRMWGAQRGRFVIFNWMGQAIVGSCR